MVSCEHLQWSNAGLCGVHCEQRRLTFAHSLGINAGSVAVDSLRVHLVSYVHLERTACTVTSQHALHLYVGYTQDHYTRKKTAKNTHKVQKITAKLLEIYISFYDFSFFNSF